MRLHPPPRRVYVRLLQAALLNQFYARKYQGKMILRFDDTNPEKEKMEFQDAILEDLVTLEVKPDRVTYTSDSFPIIENYARQLIRQGDAYMDDTPQQQMQDERLNRVNSGCRDQSPEEALKVRVHVCAHVHVCARFCWSELMMPSAHNDAFGLQYCRQRFEDLLKGEEEEARKYCLRAKMNMQDGNACMRDPVLYRYNPLPHHRTGTKCVSMRSRPCMWPRFRPAPYTLFRRAAFAFFVVG